jgi:hypothetical protein
LVVLFLNQQQASAERPEPPIRLEELYVDHVTRLRIKEAAYAMFHTSSPSDEPHSPSAGAIGH